MKNTVSNLISVAIFVGCILVLKFYFDTPYLVIIGITAIGFLGGMASIILPGSCKPSRRIFRFRFVFYGVGIGINLNFA